MVELVENIRADLNRLYSNWMSIRYPRFNNPHSVIGKYTPEGSVDSFLYYIWSFIGIVVSSFIYPIALVGLGVRFGASGIKRTVSSLGIIGTMLVFLFTWLGLVGVMIYLYGFETSIGVILAVGIALVSLVIAFLSHIYLSRSGMILVGYPSIYTAVFLPPITAALIAPGIGDDVLRQSVLFAEYILVTFAGPVNLENWLRQTFELQGVYHIVLWLAVSLLTGWITGGLIELSKLVRPKGSKNEI